MSADKKSEPAPSEAAHATAPRGSLSWITVQAAEAEEILTLEAQMSVVLQEQTAELPTLWSTAVEADLPSPKSAHVVAEANVAQPVTLSFATDSSGKGDWATGKIQSTAENGAKDKTLVTNTKTLRQAAIGFASDEAMDQDADPEAVQQGTKATTDLPAASSSEPQFKVDYDALVKVALQHQARQGCTNWDEKSKSYLWKSIYGTGPAKLGEYGDGIQMYFEFLRLLGVLFFSLFMLNIPLLALCSIGSFVDEENVLYKLIASISVGNLGSCPPGGCQTWSDVQNRLLQKEHSQEKLRDWTWLLGLLDATAACAVLVFGTVLSMFWVPWQKSKAAGRHISATRFGVRVTRLPPHIEDHASYEKKLRAHFNNILHDKINTARMTQKPKAREDTVSEVVLVRNFDGAIETLHHLGQLLLKLENFDVDIKQAATDEQVNRLQKGRESLESKVELVENSLERQIQMTDNERDVCGAYVMFKYEEWKDLVLYKYRLSTSVFCLCQKKKRRFYGRRIKVEQASDPSDIFWENLDCEFQWRILRRAFTNVMTFLSLMICALLILLTVFYSAGRAAVPSQEVWVIKNAASSNIRCWQVCNWQLYKDSSCKEQITSFTSFDTTGTIQSPTGACIDDSLKWQSPTCLNASASVERDWISARFASRQIVQCMQLDQLLPPSGGVQKLEVYACSEAALPTSVAKYSTWRPEQNCAAMNDIVPRGDKESDGPRIGTRQPITITIESASGLRHADGFFGMEPPDPYCVCSIRSKSTTEIQTKVVSDESSPVWSHTEVMDGYAVGDSLEFTVWDKDKPDSQDEILGRASLTSSQIASGFSGELMLSEVGFAITAYLKVTVAYSSAPKGFENMRTSALPITPGDCSHPVAFDVAKRASTAAKNDGRAPETDFVVSCFCTQKYREKGSSFLLPPYGTPEEEFCYDWIAARNAKMRKAIGSSLLVLALNYALMLLIRFLVTREKHSSATNLCVSQMVKLFIAIFVNTGILTLLINSNIRGHLDGMPILGDILFQGNFHDFDADWFTSVGSSVVLMTALQIFSTTSPSLIFSFILHPLQIYWYKKSMCTQLMMNQLYSLPEFQFAYRMAQTMNLAFVTLMFSAGMPILYLLAASYCAVAYWADKWALLHGCRKPPAYDHTMFTVSARLFSIGSCIHVIMAAAIYGNQTIFPSAWGFLQILASSYFGMTEDEYDEVMSAYFVGTEETRDKLFARYWQARLLDLGRNANFLLFVMLSFFFYYFAIRIIWYWILRPFLGPIMLAVDECTRKCEATHIGATKTRCLHPLDSVKKQKQEKGETHLMSYQMKERPKYHNVHVSLRHKRTSR